MGRPSKGLLVVLAALVLLSGPLGASEGDYSIRGLVRAAVRPKQLPRVRLLTASRRMLREILADTAGRFWFNEVGPGSYVVEVSAPGFRTASQNVSVNSPSSPEVVVDLEKEANSAAPIGAILDTRVPPRAWQEWEKAQQSLRDDEPDIARRHLDKAVKEYADFAAAWRLLAQLDLDDNKLDDAEHHIRLARAIEPENADGYVLDGALCNAQGRSKEALALLARAAAVNPTWRGQFELAKSHFALSSFMEAQAAAQRAIDLRTGAFPEAHVLLGNILVNLRRYPEAAREYTTFLKLAPSSPSAAPARAVLDQMKSAGVPVD